MHSSNSFLLKTFQFRPLHYHLHSTYNFTRFNRRYLLDYYHLYVIGFGCVCVLNVICANWYSKSNSISIKWNRANRYRLHMVVRRCHHFGMHRRSLIAVVPNTLTPSYCAFDVRWPIWAERIRWVRRMQQTNSTHQIVQCPFQNRIQTYWCSPLLVWYFDQLQFHIYAKQKYENNTKLINKMHFDLDPVVRMRKHTMEIVVSCHCTSW